MDEQQGPPLAGEAVRRAARVLEHHKFTVLEQDWQDGPHRVTLIATPGGGILAGAEVRSATSAAPGGCLTALTADRVTAAVDALRAWNDRHGGEFDELWLVIVTLHPGRAVKAAPGTGTGTAE